MAKTNFNYLKSDEIEKLLNQFNTRYLNSTRNKVMIELFIASGLTLSEMINLTWSDIDLQEGILKVVKEDQVERKLKITDEVIIHLLEWQQRQLEEIEEVGFVFTTGTGNKLNPSQVRTMIDNYAKKANIQEEEQRFYEREEDQIDMFDDTYLKKRINPTALRNTFAVNKLKEGNNINQIAKLLGHVNPSNIRHYKNVIESEY
ncbi:tyrosine-type recombinase/integrase [Halanaerobacter jeridensis]|uniref:Integrase/recombinase XerD n=1 Tax=Halanaerobacter jeridensis TaxID=706427 RepID=A0A939BML0_9FIRM|nr:integrase/recombinase XerD [Halanaerobacter jeridensis]